MRVSILGMTAKGSILRVPGEPERTALHIGNIYTNPTPISSEARIGTTYGSIVRATKICGIRPTAGVT